MEGGTAEEVHHRIKAAGSKDAACLGMYYLDAFWKRVENVSDTLFHNFIIGFAAKKGV